MDTKHKAPQKGGEGYGKQQRPGTEQVRSSTNIQKEESEVERLQTPKQGEQRKQKHERSGKNR